MKEAPKSGLGITQDIVDRSPEQVYLFPYKASHVPIVIRQIYLEQQYLYQHLINRSKPPFTSKNFMFKLGCVLTYDMIPQPHKAELLTPDQISAAHISISQHSEKIPGSGAFDLMWARNKLKKDSPPFLAWLDIIIKGIEKDQDRGAFIFGVMLTVMPFLMRAEARGMDQTFFGE